MPKIGGLKLFEYSSDFYQLKMFVILLKFQELFISTTFF